MASGLVYSLVPCLRTPVVDPGDVIEIAVYLTGHGRPQQNKLHVQYSSTNVLLGGRMAFGIKAVTEPASGQMVARTTGELTLHRLEPGDVVSTVVLDEGYFLPLPRREGEDEDALPQVVSERTLDGWPPIFIALNTQSDAPAGDHNICLTLTYGDEERLLQDQAMVTFRVTSRWERWRARVYTIGVLLVAPTFIMGIIGLWHFIEKWLAG